MNAEDQYYTIHWKRWWTGRRMVDICLAWFRIKPIDYLSHAPHVDGQTRCSRNEQDHLHRLDPFWCRPAPRVALVKPCLRPLF